MGDLSYTEVAVTFLLLWELWMGFWAMIMFKRKVGKLEVRAITYEADYHRIKASRLEAGIEITKLRSEVANLKSQLNLSQHKEGLDPNILRKKPKIKKAG
jgi:hypothetical protein